MTIDVKYRVPRMRSVLLVPLDLNLDLTCTDSLRSYRNRVEILVDILSFSTMMSGFSGEIDSASQSSGDTSSAVTPMLICSSN